MPIPELVEYIRDQTREGVAAQDIRAELLSVGWLESDIENGLHDVAAGMTPITSGASIHEDLAQVRGMVAHLAARLKGLETTLASLASSGVPALRAQAQLPSAFIGVERELPVRKAPNKVLRTMLFLLDLILSMQFVQYWANQVDTHSLAMQDFHVIVIASTVMLAISSIILLRRGDIWIATLLGGSALALALTEVMLSWQTYNAIGTMVALALLALLVVSAIVFYRWSIRFSEE